MNWRRDLFWLLFYDLSIWNETKAMNIWNDDDGDYYYSVQKTE